MRVICIGGGPAGLYFGLLMKLQDPDNEVIVVERNRPYDTFGWGVVFSDATMDNLKEADPVSAAEINAAFNHWDDIDIHIAGRTIRSGGHGFIGIGRKRLLNILQARCEALGVRLVFETDVSDDQALAMQYQADLVIASDGLNSRIRTRYTQTFQPDIDTRQCRFVWLGTHKLFDAFTFAFEKTEHGWFQAHAYRFDDNTSTFIVEAPESVWRAAGIEEMSQEEGVAYCEKLFARYLDGNKLITNAAHLRGSAIWIRFPRVICRQWVHWNTLPDGRRVPVVLMGDAAHTAHFSIGSGTKLALEDAIDLAEEIRGSGHDGLPDALARYEATRGVEVLKIQNAARNSTEWFENVERYAGSLPPEQFAYSLLTRSQRISHENLRVRDADYVAQFEHWLAQQAGGPQQSLQLREHELLPPMFTPFRLRGVTLKNRVVVSPMAMYSCTDGVPGDFHLVHLGSRALGGAGMVVAEMTCVSPDARITPGCPGLWSDEQRDAWRRIVDFVHANSDARIAMQIGHSGRKGSTQLGWEAMDHPLPEGNWPVISASPLPYLPGESQTPREMTRADMDRVRADFVASARRAAEAGFDWLELHCAHGYLLSSFISPLTNTREDEYGGSLAARLRFPLEVFRAVRAVWPEAKPMSVRISAHDWVEGGITPDDAVEIARAFKAAGADMIDCSSGQVSPDQAPVYGRMYQTPFADRIRNEAGIATIAVGAIFEADHVDSIIAAGRADLCAIARPHLANPAWTLQEAARIGYRDIAWPKQYQAGKRQLETNLERAAAQEKQGMTGSTASLAGRHALVTGGGRGIGAAIARRLLADGASVTLLGRDAGTLQATVQTLREHAPAGAVVSFVTADIADADSVARAFAAAAEQAGPVSMLVNNAGQAHSAPFLKTDAALWQRMLDVNLTGTFLCTQAALPAMLYAGWGRIVNVASTAGLIGYGYVSAYCAAKHGVIGLTRALALETAATGVTVNAVCPGYTETDIVRDAVANIVGKTGRTEEQARAELAARNPQRRLVQPEEVADAVAWLCQPSAAAITGQAIPVAGGEVMAG